MIKDPVNQSIENSENNLNNFHMMGGPLNVSKTVHHGYELFQNFGVGYCKLNQQTFHFNFQSYKFLKSFLLKIFFCF